MRRPLLVATNLKGRIHAYRGIELGGEVRVPRRGVRSLCGVPCKGTSAPFVVDSSAEMCKVCCDKSTGREQ